MAQQGKPNNWKWDLRIYMGEGKKVKPYKSSSNLHTYIHAHA